ncbi:MAG: oligosaccharide flippase family protein, partial [Gammaproteobacteria bacterium]|nr:oligosaccharide flippase family protein [Gammaproteobacteria bacterium]
MSTSGNNNQASAIFKNFSFLMVGKIVGDAFTFGLFIVLSRAYGQEGIGEYSFAMAYTGFFVVAADFGLYNLSIKDMSRNSCSISSYFNNILTTRLLLASGTFLVLILSIYLLPFSDNSKLVIACIGIYQVLYTLTEGFAALFVSQQRMHVAALIELSFRFSVAILGTVVVLLGGGLVYAVILFPAIALIQLLFVSRYAIKQFSISGLHFSVESIKQLLATA